MTITEEPAWLVAERNSAYDNAVHTKPASDRFAARVTRGLALSALPRPEWLVEGIVPANSLTAEYGPPKAGKTFTSTDLALSVATGRPWMGHRTRQANVVYVIGEGAAGMIARQEAWAEYNGVDDLDAMHWHRGAINLGNPLDVEAIAAYAADIAAGLVVIDTLARCSAGLDENATKDMGIMVAALDRIREASGAAVMPLHHSGKDRAKGMRGSTALLGAVDVAIEVSGGNGRVRVEVAAAKDFSSGWSESFGMLSVLDSIVLVPGDGDRAPRVLTSTAVEALEALSDSATSEGLSATSWRDVCEMPASTFFRVRKLLVDQGRVINVGTDRTPRYVPAVNGSPSDEQP